MSDSVIPSNPSTTSTATSSTQLDPVAVFSAFSNPIRWQAMKLMADGTKIRATDLATTIKRDFDICSKHLTILHDSGAVDWAYGEDRRMLFYFIPEKFRTEPGVVDYGFCRLRFS
jgi:hypothetical protein